MVISDFANIVVSGSAVSSQGLKINNLDIGASVNCDELRDLRSSGVRDVRIIHMGNKVLSCTLGGKLHVWYIHLGKLELSVMSGTTPRVSRCDNLSPPCEEIQVTVMCKLDTINREHRGDQDKLDN